MHSVSTSMPPANFVTCHSVEVKEGFPPTFGILCLEICSQVINLLPEGMKKMIERRSCKKSWICPAWCVCKYFRQIHNAILQSGIIWYNTVVILNETCPKSKMLYFNLTILVAIAPLTVLQQLQFRIWHSKCRLGCSSRLRQEKDL